MSKRGATTVLTRDNCEDEDEPEDAGVFQRASEEELKSRVVKRGARRILQTSDRPAISPFLGFIGFGTKATIPSFELVCTAPSVTNGNTVPASTVEDDADSVKKIVDTSSTNSTGDYYRQLKCLNDCFQQWIQKHLQKNPYCDFTPVCKDYERHLKEINKRSSSSDFGERKTNIAETATSNFQNTDDSVQPLGRTDSPSQSELPVAATEAPKPWPSFSAQIPAATATEQQKPFSFAAAARSIASKPQEQELVVVEDEETPPKNDFIPVEENDSIYDKRCKLFFKKDNDYADKGVGVLYLKKLDGKTQLLIRADTNLGNLLLNIILDKSLPIQRTGKNNVLLVCIPNPPIDGKVGPIPMLIRVKTSDDADELYSKLVEYAT